MKLGQLLPVALLGCFGLGLPQFSACQYCEMAADPTQQVTLLVPDPPPAPASGAPVSSLPAASQPLPTGSPSLPVSDRMATSLDNQPASSTRAAKLVALRLPTTSLPVHPSPGIVKAPEAIANGHGVGTRWADVGLLDIAAGGVFCWRTRRVL